MPDPKQIKLQLFEVAAKIVAPIVAAAASKINVAVDPTVQDAQLRQLNLFAFEELQVHYGAVKLAYEDNTASQWPDPITGASSSAAPPSAPSAPVPSPGANLSNIAGTVASIASAVAGS
jgi:hypothetical protein